MLSLHQQTTFDSPAIKNGLPSINGRFEDFAADPIGSMRHLQSTCGDIAALRENDRQLVFVFSPEYNKQILTRTDDFHSYFFAMRGAKRSSLRELTSGLLSMNGEEHAQQRRIVKSAFSRPAIQSYTGMVRVLTSRQIAEWQTGEVRDAAAETTRLMLAITSSMLFGMQDLDAALETGEMMDEWARRNHAIGTSALVARSDTFEKYEELLELSDRIAVRMRAMIEFKERDKSPGEDVLSLLIRARRAGANLTESQVVGQAALVFAAGHMTTAHTLAWMLYLLAQHPEWQGRIIDECCDDDTEVSAVLSGDVSSPMERVIRESMRVLSGSAYSQRRAARDVQVGPAVIPAGSMTVFSQFMTHRRPDLYPEPDVFNPDRWLTIRPGAYEYLPFGAGPRLCIGAALAMSIIRTVIPMMLQKNRFSVVADSEINAQVISTMLAPSTHIPLRLISDGTQIEPAAVAGNIADLVRIPSAPPETQRNAA
jgi:cytochrome P450